MSGPAAHGSAGQGHGQGVDPGPGLQTRPQVFIGDLLTSLRALQVGSADTAALVLRMLSLDSWHDIVAPALPLPGATAAAPRHSPPVADLPTPPDAAPPQPAAGQQAAADRPTAGLPAGTAAAALRVRALPAEARPAPPAWLAQATPLPRAVRAVSLPPAPLFDPQQERALLGALAASLDEDGALHVDRLLEALVRGQLPARLPLRTRWGTARGLQVLVDDGPGMGPFRQDVDSLWARLGRLLPADRLSRLAFAGSPLRGCRAPRLRGSRPWPVPAPGSAVLLVTDLGIAAAEPAGGAASPGEWLDFCQRADAAGVQLRCLVPYAATRWPPALVGRLHPIAWDRRTTPMAVRHAVAAGARQRLA